MLDLTTHIHYYELKWFDGQLLHIKTPTQELLMKMLKLQNIEETSEQLEGIIAITKEILENNIEGRTFNDEEMSQVDITIASVIIEDYMNDTLELVGE